MYLKTRTVLPSLFLMAVVVSGCTVRQDQAFTPGAAGKTDTTTGLFDNAQVGPKALRDTGYSSRIRPSQIPENNDDLFAMLRQPGQVNYTTRAPVSMPQDMAEPVSSGDVKSSVEASDPGNTDNSTVLK